ncbi:hypothetical protein PsorP6_007882 [Peronosclerospora sorghi]|uniref:Uncharacterized protein n=1 Tax=Peronosclerospora sorghi TaxID=230839 RepID=A0ACC0W9C9_9STRA|nr:hypothetical protein PsorP6_007882 [Peronosclerospora sorghi]
MHETPLVSFGLVTDVQYADVEDGWDFHRTAQRYYRNALPQLEAAIAEWLRVAATREKSTVTRLRFAVNLGDLIDGKNRLAQTSRKALDTVHAAWTPFERAIGPVHHVVGNHELYNFAASVIHEELRVPSPVTSSHGRQARYYDFQVPEARQVRFIVLDCYGVSVLGRDERDPVYHQALALLRRVNRNTNLNSPAGLVGLDRRFVAFNGAVDREQMQWLEATLERATEKREHVVLFTHIPLHPSTIPAPSSLVWNYDEVLALLHRFPCVRAVFSGHAHADGYVQAPDGHGVHYVVCDAMLECTPSETAHALVHVFHDKIVVQGYGKIPTRELEFPVENALQE